MMALESECMAVVNPEVPGCPIQLGVEFTGARFSGIQFLLGSSIERRGAAKGRADLVVDQLHNYFTNPQWRFDLPLDLKGTVFQIKVWRELQKIPAGKTIPYSVLAQRIESGARAVANACRNNPFPVIIPCHRVVAKHGIGGYSGVTQGPKVQFKKWLLHHEGVQS